MRNLIIKLGGSVITDKNRKETPRLNVIREIVGIIRDHFVVLIHGGGSFGHYTAHEVGLNKRPVSFDDALKVMKSMDKLSSIVLKVLDEFGINALLLRPRSFVINKDLKLYDVFDDMIYAYYKRGSKILTHGDVVVDIGKYRFSVCSGDVLALIFAKVFRPKAVVFLSDVDGIYTKDPKKYPDARLIEEISGSELVGSFEEPKAKDVTGGMRLKVEIIKEISNISDVYVLNGLKYENLRKFLDGDNFVGTRVRKK
ncbi:MAG: hypothetical protein J7K58_02450 [Euryarchaeota archaeon]|nr:hypothetical protein [Euryarchaeota archaeon]